MFDVEGPVFDLSDLGLSVPAGEDGFEQMVGNDQDRVDLTRLVSGSVAAHALRSFFEGTPVTLVQSPPGAGKSSLVTTVVAYLLHHSTISIHVVAPTNNAAWEIAQRIVAAAGPATAMINARGRDLPDGVVDIREPWQTTPEGRVVQPERQVKVTTVHAATAGPPRADLMVADEAYQVQYGLLAEAADRCQQVLLVGDPGQIGPVVTHDVSPWRGVADAPAARAPEVFAHMDATVLTLPCTYRLGQTTVEAIAPLYPFAFRSERPDRRLDGLAEIAAIEVSGTLGARDYARLLADRAAALVGHTLVETGPDGTETRRPLAQEEVAVVAARNELVAGTMAELSTRGLDGITVGTADALQGGQWHAVVAIDPLAAPRQVSQHALDTGRLCVMTSRHRTHLTWMFSPGWEAQVDTSALSPAQRTTSREVRARLVAAGYGEPRGDS